MTRTVAFVYKWCHIPSNKWYIGSRTATGCHPNDGYICSSKIVKPLILEHPSEWVREIIATGSQEEMLALESSLLQQLDAKNDPMSFNAHNNCGDYKVFYGDKNPMKQRMVSEKNHLAQRGQKRPSISGDNHPNKNPRNAEKIRNSHLGRAHPWMVGDLNPMRDPVVKEKLSGSNHWVNNNNHRRTCAHCGIENISKTNYTRWHGDNCKNKGK